MAKLFDVFKNFRVKRTQDAKPNIRKGYAKLKGSSFAQLKDLSDFKISYETLYSAYKTNSDVFGCVREWQENVGGAGWQLVDPDDPKREINPAIVKEITAIFNFERPWRSLRTRIVRDLGVTANAYLLILRSVGSGDVIGLQVLDPRTMSVVSDKYGNVLKYIQKIKNTGAFQEFSPEEILHVKYGSDPNNELFGFSPLETVIWEARTDLAAMVANYGFFENSAMPAVQYVLEDGMSKEEQDNAIELLRQEFKGAKNKHKGGVLAGIKEIKTLNISQKDMEFLNGRRFNTEKICSAYGVPKFFLGYTETVNNNNAVELRKGAFEGTFKPLENLLEESITQQLLRRIGLNLDFKFKPQAFEQQEKVEERALKMYKAGTITLRHFKRMVGHEITKEDEIYPNFDSYIIHQGMSDVLLEDVGVSLDPIEPVNDDSKE